MYLLDKRIILNFKQWYYVEFILALSYLESTTSSSSGSEESLSNVPEGMDTLRPRRVKPQSSSASFKATGFSLILIVFF